MGTRKTQTEHYVALVPPRGWGTHGMFSVRTMLTLSKLFHIHCCLPTALRAKGSDIIRFNLKMNPGVKRGCSPTLKFRDWIRFRFLHFHNPGRHFGE